VFGDSHKSGFILRLNVFGGTPDSVRLTAHNARAIKMINYSVLNLFSFFKHWILN